MRPSIVSLLLLFASRPVTAAPVVCDATGTLQLAGPEEPGERFVVTGVVRRAGTPVEGARVTIYHADARGYYRQGPDGRELGGREARLKGTVCTTAEGRYELKTVRPARYAGGGPRPHVHFLYWPPADDDPGADDAGQAAEFVLDSATTTRGEDGVERATFDLELR